MTEKDYKTACRMITYDKIRLLRDVEHKSIQWIADHLGLNFRTVKKYLQMDRVSSAPAVMAELPRKWEKTCGRIPADGTDRASRERVRRERVAHFIASLQGMLDDYGL